MGKFVTQLEGMGVVKRVAPTRNNDVAKTTAGALNQILDQQQGQAGKDRDEKPKRRRMGLGVPGSDRAAVRRETLLGS